jgi:hypothetical protein
MLGEPEAMISPPLSMLRKVKRIAESFGRCGTRRNESEI